MSIPISQFVPPPFIPWSPTLFDNHDESKLLTRIQNTGIKRGRREISYMHCTYTELRRTWYVTHRLRAFMVLCSKLTG